MGFAPLFQLESSCYCFYLSYSNLAGAPVDLLTSARYAALWSRALGLMPGKERGFLPFSPNRLVPQNVILHTSQKVIPKTHGNNENRVDACPIEDRCCAGRRQSGTRPGDRRGRESK